MTSPPSIDLNADLGEGFGRWSAGDDPAILKVITSANVACGFHAGDPRTMLAITAAASECGVTVGAHVSYPDLVGFGRRAMAVDPQDLAADVVYQLGALAAACAASGTRVRYVKPHGALYNATVVDAGQAAAVVEAILRVDPSLAVLGLPGSALLREADARGLAGVAEGFADRAYTADGTLVPRGEPGAVLEDLDSVRERSIRLACLGEVEALDGAVVPMRVRSVCVHGDGPRAVELARGVAAGLAEAGVALAPFA